MLIEKLLGRLDVDWDEVGRSGIFCDMHGDHSFFPREGRDPRDEISLALL